MMMMIVLCEMCIPCLCPILLYPPQNGDTAVIKATLYHQPETLKELVAVGANLSLRNQVKFQLLWPLHHVSSSDVHIRKV